MVSRSVVLVLVVLAAVAFSVPPLQRDLSSGHVSAIQYNGQLVLESDQEVASVADWGTGTASDPYVIDGLEIDAISNIAVDVTNTNVHLVLRNMRVNGSTYGGGVSLAGVTNLTVEHCSFIDADMSMGILRNIRIAENSFLRCGIHIGNVILTDRLWFGTSNVSISHNEFVGAYGIDVQNAGNVTIYANSMGSSQGPGIGVSRSQDILISDNQMQGCVFGLSIYSSKGVTAVGNEIIESTQSGFTGDSYCSNISIHHNNFINNSYPATISTTSSQVKLSLEYPYGGNYWSNASGSDMMSGAGQNVSGPDGILDEPFNVTANLVDRYPLVSPFERSNASEPPLASLLVLPQFGRPNKTFTLDASSSWDAKDPAPDMEYRWDWTNDGVWDTPYLSAMIVAYPNQISQNATARVMVRDGDGLTDEAVCRLIVDGEAPVLSTSFGPGRVVFTKHDSVWLNWSCDDNLSGISGFQDVPWSTTEKFEVLINGQEIDQTIGLFKGYSWTTYGDAYRYESNLSLNGLADGEYVVQVFAIDNAGNIGEMTIKFGVHTSPLDPQGPYGPWPLAALIAGMIVITAVIAYFALRPRKGSPEASSVPGPAEVP